MITLDQYRAVERAADFDIIAGIINLLPPNGPIDHAVYILAETAEIEGLPVGVSRAHPETINLVLHAAYRDLWAMSDDHASEMSVRLSFGGEWTRLTIPLHAIRNIIDPDVRYVATFQPLARPVPANRNVVHLSDFRS